MCPVKLDWRRAAAARAAAALLALALAFVACGGDGPAPATPTAGTTPPAPETPIAGRSPTGGPVLASVDLADTAAMLTVYGADSGDFRSDIPGTASGDFNDDGYDDLLLGARFADGQGNSRQDSGEAYVIFGGPEPPKTVDIAAGEQDVTIYGGAAGDNLGFSAAAGDVNDDGIDDILVGVPLGGSEAVYAVFGAADLPATVDIAAGEQDLTVAGPGRGSLFGDSIAAGDVNGDGKGDLVIGATFANDDEAGTAQVGAVYAVFGSKDTGGTVDTGAGEQDLVLYAKDPLDELGDTVAIGDVNGDGTGDIIAVAEAADGPKDDRETGAEVHVVYGSGALGGTLRIADGDQDVSIYGAEAHDTLGFSLASGDLNDDGFDDIIMGARLADGPDNSRGESGEAFVVYGRRDLPREIDTARDEADVIIYGTDSSDLFGSALAVADLEDAGRMQAIFGVGFAASAGNARPFAGEALVLDPLPESGSVDLATAEVRFAVWGARSGDGLGAAVAAGDVNGDGKPEIIAVAATAPGLTGAPEAGQVYVVSPRAP